MLPKACTVAARSGGPLPISREFAGQRVAWQTHSKRAYNRRAVTIKAFQFLKDLGFQKPSWLPSFSGKKGGEQEKVT